MALADASRALRASTLCAGAVPASTRNSPTRMQNFRAIRCPHSQKINLRTKGLDFTFNIPNGHTYTPEVPRTEPNCFFVHELSTSGRSRLVAWPILTSMSRFFADWIILGRKLRRICDLHHIH